MNSTQQTIRWKTKHHPISVSVCSNVPGYDCPTCFVNPDLKSFVKGHGGLHDWDCWSHLWVSQWDVWPLEADLEKKLKKYKQEVPLLGFNSTKYDMNLIKMELAKTLHLHETSEYFVVKKNNQYMCLTCPEFRFLDISHYLAPGYGEAKFFESLSDRRI